MENYKKYTILGFNFFVYNAFSFCYDESKKEIVIFDEEDDLYFFIIKFRQKDNDDYSLIFSSRRFFLQEIDGKDVYIRRYNNNGEFF